MAIRAVVFDIGGIFEIVPEGGDPTRRFPEMIARWEQWLELAPGELRARIRGMNEELARQGKDPELGTCSEAEWLAALQQATGINDTDFQAFIRDYWNIYLGSPNTELMAYFQTLCPRFRTALLSNSGVGARREEQDRYHFAELTDLIIYSHEEGVAKPDPRIYAITCDRLGMQPQEIVFLDDNAPNIVAAREYGIHAILFHDNAQAIAEIAACIAANQA